MVRYKLSPAAAARRDIVGYFDPDSLAHTYTYNGPHGAMDTDSCTDGVYVYVKTITYTGSELTCESMWVKQ